ncbi:MAG TPA: LacI family DNA-binding transcriptional regulator [Armatimonadota bacterium]|nr:LacI family DNA-binding transcriptional regulator [Armatimonadota bacterium]
MSKPMDSTHAPDRPVLLKDIAARCGVCAWTVSAALRHDARVKAATAERIRAVAAEMGYNPAQQIAARRMVMRQHGLSVVNQVIACIFPLPTVNMHYFNKLYLGILHELTSQGFALLSLDSYRIVGDGTTAAQVPPIMYRGEIDGLILLPVRTPYTPLISELRANQGFGDRPIVSLMDAAPEAVTVMGEEETGVRQSVEHVLRLGHRQLAYFMLPTPNAREARRLDIIRAVLRENGLDPAQSLQVIEVEEEMLTPEKYYHAELAQQVLKNPTAAIITRFLRSHPQTRAFLCVNDICALFLWQIVEQAGLRVPDDISIIGFDDTDVKSTSTGGNLLSTVRVPLFDIGRMAGCYLIAKITKTTLFTDDLPLLTEFIDRASTAPPPHSTPL